MCSIHCISTNFCECENLVIFVIMNILAFFFAIMCLLTNLTTYVFLIIEPNYIYCKPVATSKIRKKISTQTFLTLGVHAPEGYSSCPVCVSVCVCVSVRNLNLGTGASRGLNEGTSE